MNLEVEVTKLTPKPGDVLVVTVKREALGDMDTSMKMSYMKSVGRHTRRLLKGMGLGEDVRMLVVMEGFSVDCIPVVDIMSWLATKKGCAG